MFSRAEIIWRADLICITALVGPLILESLDMLEASTEKIMGYSEKNGMDECNKIF